MDMDRNPSMDWIGLDWIVSANMDPCLNSAVQTRRGVLVRSRHEQQRSQKLSRRQSTTTDTVQYNSFNL